MSLENHFYTVDEISWGDDGLFRAVVRIAHEHPIFAGHFPGRPVVPGVCTLTIIRECLGRVLQRDVRFDAIRECKYTSALLPFDGLKIELDFAIAGQRQLKGCVRQADNGQVVLKLKASLSM